MVLTKYSAVIPIPGYLMADRDGRVRSFFSASNAFDLRVQSGWDRHPQEMAGCLGQHR
jgi:hypothetical protein